MADSMIQTEAQAEKATELSDIVVETAVDGEKKHSSGDEISQQQSVNILQPTVTMAEIEIERTDASPQEPKPAD
jgi:hypothetical protein